MTKRLLSLLLIGTLLAGCRFRIPGSRAGGFEGSSTRTTSISTATDFPTAPPTATPPPPPTITPTPRPDVTSLGLPAEAEGTTAYDFAASVCAASWSHSDQAVPCNGQDETTTSGYVALLDGSKQGLARAFDVLLMYPPHGSGDDTLSGQYPAFSVQQGDRFRAVLDCRIHNFCDVDFGLDYLGPNGRSGLKHWSHLFTGQPVVVDYSLDGIAGLRVQFILTVRRHGEGLQDYAVWIAPHIYRP